MSTLIFSDLHASRLACLDVEKLLPGFQSAICCGDVVGYGSDPEYCLDFIRRNHIHTVKGNHDAMVVGEEPVSNHPAVRATILATRERLNGRRLAQIADLPESVTVDGVYATHTLAGEYIFGLHDIAGDAAKAVEEVDQAIIAIGHTHTRFCVSYGEKTIVNPSSITRGRRGQTRGYATVCGERIELKELVHEVA